MVKVFPPVRDSSGRLIRGMRIFRFRKLGPTDLTWEEKNSTDYRYHPKDTSKLQGFIDRNKKEVRDGWCFNRFSTSIGSNSCR